MAERRYKCPKCQDRKIKSEMTKVGDRHYCNVKCLDIKLEEDRIKEIENKEWEELFEYIMKLHGLVIMPKQAIFRLQDLRAGHITKDGKRKRLWKSGVSYSVMREAYDLANKNIQWAINKKLDDNRDIRAINYCMSIMIGEINNVIGNRERRLRQEREKIKKLFVETDSTEQKNIEINYNRINNKKDEMDISSFL